MGPRLCMTQVDPNSPGAKAGIQIGDVITQVNGGQVNDSGDLQVHVVQRSRAPSSISPFCTTARRKQFGVRLKH